MPQSLDDLAASIQPDRTILFFGAGASIPSGAPSVPQLTSSFAKAFSEDSADYNLAEFTEIIEQKSGNRKKVIRVLRSSFKNLKPTGGLKNIPLYDWRAIYTTNYDKLIEDFYEAAEKPIYAISSNFDFGDSEDPLATKLFKIHGSIEKDTTDGFSAPIILTESDYEHTKDYREKIYARLSNDLNEFDVLIVGYSLSDPDLKREIDRAAKIGSECHGNTRIYVLSYTRDENRALLLERKNINVAFGGIDELFEALAEKQTFQSEPKFDFDDPLSNRPKLRPVTIDINHNVTARDADPSAMYNGWAAGYPEIANGLTYARTLTNVVVTELERQSLSNAVILGPSGYGKTTCARQIVLALREDGYHCYEHKADHRLQPEEWLLVAQDLAENGKKGVLLIDDAHHHLYEINSLLEEISSLGENPFFVLMTSSRNLWGPRIKSAPFFKSGREFQLKKLSGPEIDNLLNLLDREPRVRRLVSNSFSGFTRFEKRRRLEAKCDSEPFVCLKNIFASDNFDHIILREFAELRFAELREDLRAIYRVVAAMEDAGVRVHRQLVIRMLGISADKIAGIISDLDGIVSEYAIDPREAVFGWKGRHPVIVGIVAKHKYFDEDAVVSLLDRVIDSISPSYDIEIKTIRDICTLQNGIRRIPDKREQNRLYQRVISLAPSERVPRHRLIQNLISLDDFEQAETEIPIFGNDFKGDGAVARYKIGLAVRRSKRAKGLLEEDRISILLQTLPYAEGQLRRYKDNKYFLREYANLCAEIYKKTGDTAPYDRAIYAMNGAFNRIADPEIQTMIRKLEFEFSGRTS